MRAVHREGLVPLIQMHDELGFPVATEREGARVTEIMREVIPLRVPMLVDAEYGVSWGAAKNDWKNRDKVRARGGNAV